MGHIPDFVVVGAYLTAVVALGLRTSRSPTSAASYVFGDKDLPWWAVCLSLLATETSTLTLISVPGFAYGHGWGFTGLACGYVLGRAVVAFVLLPHYMKGGFVSAYHALGARFGKGMRVLAALTFIVTRLLAEGVRLFAAALPLTFLLQAAGLTLDPRAVIIGLTALTALYAVAGGVRAVVWTDALQLLVYVTGALACVAVLASHGGASGLASAAAEDKFRIFEWRASVFKSPFSPLSALIGGAVFSIASHGADQLIVQRVLACRSLADAQKAMIGSGVLAAALFTILSFVGSLLWLRYGGLDPTRLGLKGPDDVFPHFIAADLGPGLCGLLVAGVLAAAMGSLSSALNALSTCVIVDLGPVLKGRAKGGLAAEGLSVPRRLTGLFTVLMVLCAFGFSEARGEAVVAALGIAGYAYGALLGAFCLGRAVPQADGRDAVIAFLVSNLALALVIGKVALAFTWYVPLGTAVSVGAGWASSALRRRLAAAL